MATTTTKTETNDYWGDEWEQQARPCRLEHHSIKAEDTKTEDDWEDDWERQADMAELEHYGVKTEVKNKDKTEDIKTSPTAPLSCWNKTRTLSKTIEYKTDFPELDQEKVQERNVERKKHEKKVVKSKNNIFTALDDDDDDDEEVPTVQHTKPPRMEPRPKDERFEKHRTRIVNKHKGRLCRSVTDGTHCTYGERCVHAHSLQELRPDRCNRGQKCRCVVVGYDKRVVNNQRSNRVCMYTHDESFNDYTKRTGLDKYRNARPTISVHVNFRDQATEMGRVAGIDVRTR